MLHRYPTHNRLPTMPQGAPPGLGSDVRESDRTTHGDNMAMDDELAANHPEDSGQCEPPPALEEPGPPLEMSSGEQTQSTAAEAPRPRRRRSASESDVSRLEEDIGKKLLPDPPDKRTRGTEDIRTLDSELNREQARAVALARSNMTREQLAKIDKRIQAITSTAGTG
ncbi:hypothetical protein C0992_009519, partial [Termitomyces sp. T32_za158]